MKIFAEIQDKTQLSDYLKKNATVVVDVTFDSPIQNADVYLNLPHFCRGNDIKIIENAVKMHKNLSGIIANSIYGVAVAKKFGLPLVLGLGMNVYNYEQVLALGASEYIYSSEISEKDILDIQKVANGKGIVFSYGHLRMLTTPAKIAKRQGYILKEEKLAHQYYAIFNKIPHVLGQNVQKVSNKLYFNMLGLNKDEIIFRLKNPFFEPKEFTRGRFGKGVL